MWGKAHIIGLPHILLSKDKLGVEESKLSQMTQASFTPFEIINPN